MSVSLLRDACNMLAVFRHDPRARECVFVDVISGVDFWHFCVALHCGSKSMKSSVLLVAPVTYTIS